MFLAVLARGARTDEEPSRPVCLKLVPGCSTVTFHRACGAAPYPAGAVADPWGVLRARPAGEGGGLGVPPPPPPPGAHAVAGTSCWSGAVLSTAHGSPRVAVQCEGVEATTVSSRPLLKYLFPPLYCRTRVLPFSPCASSATAPPATLLPTCSAGTGHHSTVQYCKAP